MQVMAIQHAHNLSFAHQQHDSAKLAVEHAQILFSLLSQHPLLVTLLHSQHTIISSSNHVRCFRGCGCCLLLFVVVVVVVGGGGGGGGGVVVVVVVL